MKAETFSIDSPETLRKVIKIAWTKQVMGEKFEITISGVTAKKRTLPQNAALHLYTKDIAEQMNNAGITQKALVGLFKAGFELPVTKHMVKDIFREVGSAMYQKKSTADLETVEMSEVYRVVDKRFGEVTGVRSEWPSGRG